MFEAFDRYQPRRVVIDSLSEIRLLAQSSLRYRRQILALKYFFAQHDATVLMLDDLTAEATDKTVHSIAHGVIRLEQRIPEYGAERRRLQVVKYRGNRYRGGYHDFLIAEGGIRVFPRLVSAEHRQPFDRQLLTSDTSELNDLLGGGIERGSSVLVLGPAGSGKTFLALTFIVNAARRGERSALFVFDEEVGLLRDRARGLGIDLDKLEADGLLFMEQVDAAELSPGEFSFRVQTQIDQGAKTLVVDSLNGYQAAMPEEQALVLHMHELLQYCNRQGVTTFLTVANHGLIGDMRSPVDLTYLADTVVLLRYFEALGKVRRAISVVKKRTSAHENSIREYRLSARGLQIGPPLASMQGVLRGVPELVDDSPELPEQRP
jgi:circadian clock protein KaiC